MAAESKHDSRDSNIWDMISDCPEKRSAFENVSNRDDDLGAVASIMLAVANGNDPPEDAMNRLRSVES